MIFITDRGVVHVTRETFRKAQRVAIRSNTISAGFAVVSFAALCWLQIYQPGAPMWLVYWNAVSGFFNLANALHGWRYADEKTAQLVLAVSLPKET